MGVNGDSANHGASIVLRSGTITDEMKWKIVPDGKVYKLIPKTGEAYGLGLSSDGSSVHQYVYQQGESDWYISQDRIFILNVNNYFDEGYNVKNEKTTFESTQYIKEVMVGVEEFYFKNFNLIIESTVQKFTSPLDSAKGEVTSETLDDVCDYTDSEDLRDALQNGYWGDSTTTNVIWTGHTVVAYSQENRSHSLDKEGMVFLLDDEAFVEVNEKSLIHELGHQLGAPDHYHEEFNGECINKEYCINCSSNPRSQFCILGENKSSYFCGKEENINGCTDDINKHLNSHH